MRKVRKSLHWLFSSPSITRLFKTKGMKNKEITSWVIENLPKSLHTFYKKKLKKANLLMGDSKKKKK